MSWIMVSEFYWLNLYHFLYFSEWFDWTSKFILLPWWIYFLARFAPIDSISVYTETSIMTKRRVLWMFNLELRGATNFSRPFVEESWVRVSLPEGLHPSGQESTAEVNVSFSLTIAFFSVARGLFTRTFNSLADVAHLRFYLSISHSFLSPAAS